MLSLTKKALEEFDNQHDFERMCADIINALGNKNVVPIAPRGGSDGGKDITFTTPSGGKGLACATLRNDSDTKFHEDFSQRKRGEFELYYFFTNQYLTAGQKKKYIRYGLDSLDAELIPLDLEGLRSLLDSALKTTRKQFLQIDDDNSLQIKGHLTQVLKYPKTLSHSKYNDRASFIEFKWTEPYQREIYYYLYDYADEELALIPEIGSLLVEYKEFYYKFRDETDNLYAMAIDVIGKNVAVRFMEGWRIYLDYFLLRAIGMEMAEIAKFIGLNYEITFTDCERIYNLLKYNPIIFYKAEYLVGFLNKMVGRINDLKKILLKE